MPGHKLNKNKKESVIKLRNTEPARWSAPLTDHTAVTVWKCFHLLRNVNTGQPSKSFWSAINECFHLTVMSATLHKRAPHLHRLHQRAPGDELFTYVCFHFWLKIPLDSQMGLISALKKKKKKMCLFLKRTVVYIMNSLLFKGDWAGHENLKFLLH